MSITRRQLISSVSVAALGSVFKTGSLGASVSKSQMGQINLGLCGVSYYSLFFPFLNVWKSAKEAEVICKETRYTAEIALGMPNSAWGTFLDENGELVKPLPPGTKAMTRVIYAPSEVLPEGYNRVGEEWILKWDGGAGTVSVAGASASSRFGNRIAWRWGSNDKNMWITFADMNAENPPHNIRVCERRYEALLDSGEYFNPKWLEKVKAGSGIVRFMDWQSTNNNHSTQKFSDIPTVDYCSYGATAGQPTIKGGMPLVIMSTLANKIQSHAWICIPTIFGTRKHTRIKTITNANPAIVVLPGHDWNDGDEVIIYGGDWPQIERNRFVVGQSDKTSGTFAILGVDGSHLPRFRSNSAAATAPYDFDKMASEVALLAAYFRDNMDASLVTYFEFGNEDWNFLFNSAQWLAAQARGKFPRDDQFIMAGYLAAHCMKVIRSTYGISARSRWRGVLATQTSNDYVTKQMIVGVKQYISESGLSLKVSDLFDDVAITGYFGGNFDNARKDMIFGWIDESEQRWKDGKESNKYSYFNRLENEDLFDGRYTHLGASVLDQMSAWEKQKSIADSYGLGLIQYEGGNGNAPSTFSNLTPDEYFRLFEFFSKSCHTQEDAHNYAEIFSRFVALGGRYPAKFVEASPVTRWGNWGALRYPGDDNPVWQEVVKFNNRL